MSLYRLRPSWTPLTVILAFIGFMIDWRAGLAVVVAVIWGDRLRAEAQRLAARLKSGEWGSFRLGAGFRPTGNAAFDAYRASVLKRLEEQRRALIEEQRAFEAFMADLSQARDKEEFDKFMAERNRRAA